jgi:hypothetical protein
MRLRFDNWTRLLVVSGRVYRISAAGNKRELCCFRNGRPGVLKQLNGLFLSASEELVTRACSMIIRDESTDKFLSQMKRKPKLSLFLLASVGYILF